MGVLAGKLCGELWRGHGRADARKLADVPASELHAAQVGAGLREVDDEIRVEIDPAGCTRVCDISACLFYIRRSVDGGGGRREGRTVVNDYR